jgi:repressor LexA
MKVRKDLILEFIRDYIKKYGYSPAVRDIASKFKISTSTAYEYMKLLKEEGRLDFAPGISRSIDARDFILSARRIPILGHIKAGKPTWAEQDILGWIGLPFSQKEEIFALRVEGDSMIGVGIYEGDLVLVRKQNYANPGEIVVAIIDNELTLKRLVKTDKGLFLKAENERYPPIKVNQETKILGKVLALVRKYE